MSTIQRNKEVIRKLYEQSLNKRNMRLLQDLISEEYTGSEGKKGAAGFEEPVAALFRSFPDLQWTMEEIIAEGDKVAVRWKWQGTHTGPYQQLAPSGKRVVANGISMYELKDGKIINAAIQVDRLDFLQQLEVIPRDLTLLSYSNRRVPKEQVCFIDKFFVPASAKGEFYERMRINRSFIKNLPGFIEDTVYEHIDEKKNLICITVARWESKDALEKAKETVQAEYKKQSFNPAQMMERLGISMDRAIYKETESSN